MNRAQKRSYMKLHENDKRATFCKNCGFKTISKLYTDHTKDLNTSYNICEVCGYKKELMMRIPPDSYTSEVSIYNEERKDN